MSSRITRLLGVFPALPEPDGKECAADLPLPVAANSLLGRLRLRLRTDEQLIADLIQGESDALTVLFERHSPLVFRIARRVLRNDAEAEDAVQRIFLLAKRRLTKKLLPRGEEPFRDQLPEMLLTLEIVKKASLGQACGLADLVNRSAGVALSQHQLLGGVEQLLFGQ